METIKEYIDAVTRIILYSPFFMIAGGFVYGIGYFLGKMYAFMPPFTIFVTIYVVCLVWQAYRSPPSKSDYEDFGSW